MDLIEQRKIKLQEKISDIHYDTNLTPSEKQEQIKELEREIDMELFEGI